MLFLILSILAGALTTFIALPLAMEFLKSSGVIGIDQQKKDKPKLPTSGGIAVIAGFFIATTFFIGLHTFFPGAEISNSLVLAALSSVLIISMIGLVDDIHVKDQEEKVKEEQQLSVGFRSWWIKPILALPAALPLMVVKAGHAVMHFPILGKVTWGFLYPLVLVPMAVVGVSNATNMLAGQNGLEAGTGSVALTALGLFAFLNGSIEGAIVALGMAFPLIAFLRYNWYPAEILPGDSLTYAVGSAFVSTTVIANIEKFAIFIFLPWLLEGFLKARSGFKASSLGNPGFDGSLSSKHRSIYSITHLFMEFDLTEEQLVLAMIGVETALCILAFLVFL
ncbi:MAG: hypothetical protein SVV03_04395 [Candidatus Nanohaloarchaea archaeon]|nr:hypothetical protein [Candidatus Nanohaloarchaea archaeon]